jgi:hypothetical protein
MATRLDLSGLRRLRARLMKLGAPSDGALTVLGVSWAKVIDDDNRAGVLAGTDRYGHPMAPVTYRPKGGALKPTAARRNTNNARARRGAFAGFGPSASGLHNNLTPAEYRRLAGPPLAPRGAFSRVITNLKTRMDRLGPWRFTVVGYWDDVVSTKGIPFLMAHFTGRRTGRNRATRLPRRDLRGIRPEGRRRAFVALKAWAIDLLRSAPHGG